MIEIIFVDLPLALFVAMFCFGLKYILAGSQKKNERLLEKAIAAGHVVDAKRVSTKTEWRLDQTTPCQDDKKMVDIGIFEYKYKRKKYQVKFSSENCEFPKELELYFIKNPAKAAMKNNIAYTEISFWKYFLRVFIFLVIIRVL